MPRSVTNPHLFCGYSLVDVGTRVEFGVDTLQIGPGRRDVLFHAAGGFRPPVQLRVVSGGCGLEDLVVVELVLLVLGKSAGLIGVRADHRSKALDDLAGGAARGVIGGLTGLQLRQLIGLSPACTTATGSDSCLHGGDLDRPLLSHLMQRLGVVQLLPVLAELLRPVGHLNHPSFGSRSARPLTEASIEALLSCCRSNRYRSWAS